VGPPGAAAVLAAAATYSPAPAAASRLLQSPAQDQVVAAVDFPAAVEVVVREQVAAEVDFPAAEVVVREAAAEEVAALTAAEAEATGN